LPGSDISTVERHAFPLASLTEVAEPISAESTTDALRKVIHEADVVERRLKYQHSKPVPPPWFRLNHAKPDFRRAYGHCKSRSKASFLKSSPSKEQQVKNRHRGIAIVPKHNKATAPSGKARAQCPLVMVAVNETSPA